MSLSRLAALGTLGGLAAAAAAEADSLCSIGWALQHRQIDFMDDIHSDEGLTLTQAGEFRSSGQANKPHAIDNTALQQRDCSLTGNACCQHRRCFGILMSKQKWY